MSDYYNILNVAKDADINQIKKAYRKLAIKWHPDKNQDNKEEAEAKFKEISKAYSVLSDEEKKKIYDQYGEEGLNGQNMGGFDPNDIFKTVFSNMSGFGNFGGFGGFPGFGNNERQQKKKRKIVNINLSLKDIYLGTNKKIKLKVNHNCNYCFKKVFHKCTKCKGKGRIRVTRMIGPGMMQQFDHTCDKCKGTGIVRMDGINCNYCNNTRKTKKEIQLDYLIQSGTKNGEHKIFRNMGNEDLNGNKEDIVLVVNVKESNGFKRQNCHLLYNKDISLAEALCGPKYVFEHINGEKILINENKIVKDNSYHKIENKGMPIKGYNLFGDLFIVYNIKYPEFIKNEHKGYIYKIFNQLLPKIDLTNANRYNCNLLKDLSESDLQDKMNDESSDEEGGGGGVQCAQQ